MPFANRANWLDRSASDICVANLICAEGLPGALFEIRDCLRVRDEWTDRIRHETDRMRPRFLRNPAEFDHSEARYRMIVFITVLQRDLGVYCPAEYQQFSDAEFFGRSELLFAHGVLLHRKGTCSSMPPVLASIGRMLGYPLKIVKTVRHRFLRWDGDDDRFNIECTTKGFVTYPDEHYLQWPFPISPEEAQRHGFLKSMSYEEELAAFIATRAQLFNAHGRLRDAAFDYARSCQWDSENRVSKACLVDTMNRWKAALEAMMMLGFPALTINFPPRRFPRIPVDLERGLVHMAVKQDLLNDPPMKAKWWDQLRRNPKFQPPDLPAHISVRFQSDPPYQMEYRLSREFPNGFKPQQPA